MGSLGQRGNWITKGHTLSPLCLHRASVGCSAQWQHKLLFPAHRGNVQISVTFFIYSVSWYKASKYEENTFLYPFICLIVAQKVNKEVLTPLSIMHIHTFH